jgi:hypothetical protein
MRKQLILQLLFAISCFAHLPNVAGAQGYYRWHPLYTSNDSGYTYSFSSVSSIGNVCTVAGLRMLGKPFGSRIMFFRSNDGGITWAEQDPGLPPENPLSNHITKVQQIDSLNVVAIGDTGLIVKTTDGGATWQRLQLNTTYDLWDVHFSDPMTGIVVSPPNVFTTSNGGANWKETYINGVLPIKQGHSYGNGKFFVTTFEAGPVYLTTDNFETIDSSTWIYPLSDVAHDLVFCNFLDKDTIEAYGYYDGDGTGRLDWTLITRSIDGGKDWNEIFISKVIDYTQCMSSLAGTPVLMGGGPQKQLIYSFDHGLSWNADTLVFDTVYNTAFVVGLAVMSNGNAVGVTYNTGVKNAHGNIIVGTRRTDAVQPNQSLSYQTQLYPNPATTRLNITSSYSAGTIHLYNILGREVMTGMLSADGHATLDVSHLPRGIYDVLLDHYGLQLPVGMVAVQ